jgi:arylformamidase
MKIIDLSHPLHTGMQVYPGDPEVVIEPILHAETDWVNVLSVHMGSQSGTHVDSPFHVLNNLATLDQIPLQHFVGPWVMVDATGLAPREAISHILFTRESYDQDSVVLIRTDWSKHFGSTHYLAHPYPTLESLEYLLSQGVRSIALDFLSLDRTPDNPSEATLENHYLWSRAGGIIGENFTNFESLSNDTPYISFLPLNMGASDGGPVRAVALSSLDKN